MQNGVEDLPRIGLAGRSHMLITLLDGLKEPSQR